MVDLYKNVFNRVVSSFLGLSFMVLVFFLVLRVKHIAPKGARNS
ncbi:MAG: hypothetical protein HW401_13 [Parcubacteria group bacterium]|nr:hypothetical protein [Parcubacteria group bacterium]